MEELKKPHLENIGNAVAEIFSENSKDFKIILSETPQIGVVQITIDEARVAEILELERVVKRYFVSNGFRISDYPEEDKDNFEVKNEKTFENYSIGADYNSGKLTITVTDVNSDEEFSLFS